MKNRNTKKTILLVLGIVMIFVPIFIEKQMLVDSHNRLKKLITTHNEIQAYHDEYKSFVDQHRILPVNACNAELTHDHISTMYNKKVCIYLKTYDDLTSHNLYAKNITIYLILSIFIGVFLVLFSIRYIE
jgi:hypothetical protein